MMKDTTMRDTTNNYQTLAQAIVLSALEDSQGEGKEAHMASRWLDTLDPTVLKLTGLEQCIKPRYIIDNRFALSQAEGFCKLPFGVIVKK